MFQNVKKAVKLKAYIFESLLKVDRSHDISILPALSNSLLIDFVSMHVIVFNITNFFIFFFGMNFSRAQFNKCEGGTRFCMFY